MVKTKHARSRHRFIITTVRKKGRVPFLLSYVMELISPAQSSYPWSQENQAGALELKHQPMARDFPGAPRNQYLYKQVKNRSLLY